MRNKYIMIIVAFVCVVSAVSPLQANASQMIQGRNVVFEFGYEIDDNNHPNISESRGWLYIHDRTTNNKYLYVMGKNTTLIKINSYKASNWNEYMFRMSTQLYEYKKDSGQNAWRTATTPSSTQYSTGIAVSQANNLYVACGGTVGTITFDGVVLWNPTNPSPTPTVPPTPTPIPVSKVEMSSTGFAESMSVALEFMRIPIEIAGFEVNMFEIMMFGFACTIVIYLVFAPVKK